MAAAAVTAAVLALVTIVAFGTTPWTEFFHWLPLTSKALLSQDHTAWADHTDWYKFQSLFAMVRLLRRRRDAGLAAAICADRRRRHRGDRDVAEQMRSPLN